MNHSTGAVVNQGKSLRQLATELGVGHAYLIQVTRGKRPTSENVAEALKMISMKHEWRSQVD